MTSEPKSFLLKAYRAGMSLSTPAIDLALSHRQKVGKEDPERVSERKGYPGATRPKGVLVWIHGASVGESLSILPLIERIIEDHPTFNVLVTTGTVTSAALMAKRLPEQAIHQYGVIDQPNYVRRFLDAWAPDAAIFIESELWPTMLGELSKREIPTALVNGRLSPTSFAKWQRRPRAAKELLNTFDLILGQDDENAARLSQLAGRPAEARGNLKRASAPLPTTDSDVAQTCKALGNRPTWLAASTHPGEEELILDAHLRVRKAEPDALVIIAPRHPARGDSIAAMLRENGVNTAQRSRGDAIDGDTSIYVADTLGELGIFYRVANVAFIGGSLLEIGGHNPMEPARLGTAIVTGPHIFNFAETFHDMRRAEALALVRNERDLAGAVQRLLADERTRAEMVLRAQTWADEGGEKVLSSIMDTLRPFLRQGSGDAC